MTAVDPRPSVSQQITDDQIVGSLEAQARWWVELARRRPPDHDDHKIAMGHADLLRAAAIRIRHPNPNPNNQRRTPQ